MAGSPEKQNASGTETTSSSSHDAVPLRAAAVRVVELLKEAGYTAYFAGGCVRDELMGNRPTDYDVATEARPEQVRALFKRTRAVGEHFGVILVQLMGHSIEVATFRSDGMYSDQRRPDQVVFTDAQHDAQRRDFTINGLFEDPTTGDIVDYVGGQADLKAKIIRAIGEADARLNEDHLRALRAVRFAARFGFTIDPQTKSAIRANARELGGVSRERVGQEMRMMLTGPRSASALADIQDLELDSPVLLEQHTDAELTSVRAVSPKDSSFALKLSAWAIDRREHAQADETQTILPGSVSAGLQNRAEQEFSPAIWTNHHELVRRWRAALMLTNREREELRDTLEDERRIRTEWASLAVAGRKRLASHSSFRGALAIVGARHPDLAREVGKQVESLSLEFGGLAPTPFLDGSDLLDMGWKPGPRFKRILDQVYDAQLEGRVRSVGEARAFVELLRRET